MKFLKGVVRQYLRCLFRASAREFGSSSFLLRQNLRPRFSEVIFLSFFLGYFLLITGVSVAGLLLITTTTIVVRKDNIYGRE